MSHSAAIVHHSNEAPEQDVCRVPKVAAVAHADLLNRMREQAQGHRASARMGLFEACRLLSPGRKDAEEAHLHAVVRTLDQVLDQKAAFRAPGASDLSFDVAWLLRVVDRAAQKDFGSLSLLFHSRVAAEKALCIYLLNQRLRASIARCLRDNENSFLNHSNNRWVLSGKPRRTSAISHVDAIPLSAGGAS